MPKCAGDRLGFGNMDRRLIDADFSGGDLPRNGGMMLLRQIDERIGLTQSAAAALSDPRDPGRICALDARHAGATRLRVVLRS